MTSFDQMQMFQTPETNKSLRRSPSSGSLDLLSERDWTARRASCFSDTESSPGVVNDDNSPSKSSFATSLSKNGQTCNSEHQGHTCCGLGTSSPIRVRSLIMAMIACLIALSLGGQLIVHLFCFFEETSSTTVWTSIGIALIIFLVAMALAFLLIQNITNEFERVAKEAESLQGREGFSYALLRRPSKPNDHTTNKRNIQSKIRWWTPKELRAVERSLRSLRDRLGVFAKFVPRAVVSRIVSGDHLATRLYVVRRSVTILFSDIANFTTISENLPLPILVVLMRDYLSEMARVIEQLGGTIGDFIGDGIMAFFNSPERVHDHAHAACECALRMHERLVVLNERWQQYGIRVGKYHYGGPEGDSLPRVWCRVGIHTGIVFAGNIGSPDKMKFGIVGDAVNLASRVENLNKLYASSVLVTADTYNRVKETFIARPVDAVAVKGRRSGTLVYELRNRARTTHDVFVRGLSPDQRKQREQSLTNVHYTIPITSSICPAPTDEPIRHSMDSESSQTDSDTKKREFNAISIQSDALQPYDTSAADPVESKYVLEHETITTRSANKSNETRKLQSSGPQRTRRSAKVKPLMMSKLVNGTNKSSQNDISTSTKTQDVIDDESFNISSDTCSMAEMNNGPQSLSQNCTSANSGPGYDCNPNSTTHPEKFEASLPNHFQPNFNHKDSLVTSSQKDSSLASSSTSCNSELHDQVVYAATLETNTLFGQNKEQGTLHSPKAKHSRFNKGISIHVDENDDDKSSNLSQAMSVVQPQPRRSSAPLAVHSPSADYANARHNKLYLNKEHDTFFPNPLSPLWSAKLRRSPLGLHPATTMAVRSKKFSFDDTQSVDDLASTISRSGGFSGETTKLSTYRSTGRRCPLGSTTNRSFHVASQPVLSAEELRMSKAIIDERIARITSNQHHVTAISVPERQQSPVMEKSAREEYAYSRLSATESIHRDTNNVETRNVEALKSPTYATSFQSANNDHSKYDIMNKVGKSQRLKDLMFSKHHLKRSLEFHGQYTEAALLFGDDEFEFAEAAAPVEHVFDQEYTSDKHLCQAFSDAFRLYESRCFEHACDSLLDVLEEYPEDVPALRLLSRCLKYIETPPEKDWDGLEKLQEK